MDMSNCEGSLWEIVKKIERLRMKLIGVHPLYILEQELRESRHYKEKYFRNLIQICNN